MNNYARKKKADFWLALAIFALVMFGIIAIYSVSKYYSLQITDGETDRYYLVRQIIWAVIGLLAWAIVQSIDYSFWQKNTRAMFFITLILLVLPIFFGHQESRSSTRWIGFGFANFQPSELAKITLILYLSGWISNRQNQISTAKISINFFVFMAVVSLLMLIQKDLGTLAVMVGIAGAIYVISGAPTKYLFGGAGLAFLLAWLAIKIEPYRLKRLTTFLNPENDFWGTGYHIRNASIAIGSGGLFGLGFGQSKQKYLYLPEAHTDSIFAVVAEELGFLRASLIIILLGFVAVRGYKIAKNAPDTFSSLVAVGVTTWIIWQAFINIGAMLSMLPLTGVPLPFLSYGGSSLVFLLIGVGILTNISKYSNISNRK